jgi:hypothetical protein
MKLGRTRYLNNGHVGSSIVHGARSINSSAVRPAFAPWATDGQVGALLLWGKLIA